VTVARQVSSKTIIGGSSGADLNFTVTNGGNVNDTLDLTCASAAPVWCSNTPAYVVLSWGAGTTVTPHVSGDRVGGSSWVKLTAAGRVSPSQTAKDSTNVLNAWHQVTVTPTDSGLCSGSARRCI